MSFVALACSRTDGQQALAVAAPDDPLTIVPRTDVAVMGLVGGPFRPIRCGFVLGNAGGAPLTWSVEVEGTWLHLDGPSEGVLPPHGSLALRLDVVSEEAAKLPAGRHSARLRFRMGDDDDLAGVREVMLDAVPPAEGWTEFSPSPDTRTIYVSSSTGDDANGGFSEDAAKRTIAAGKALLRHGFPDWLLLRRGDVWEESLGQWKMSGRSPTEPMLVATYGDDDTRPLLRTGTRGGIWTHGGGRSPPTIDNLAIVGLHFHADDRDGTENSKGARMLQPGAHVLFEDCMFEAFHTNVVFQGKSDERLVDYRLRRSVIVDAYAVHDGGHPQGLYANGVDGLLIEENVFDHNGWHESVPDAGADIYSHNIYINHDNTGVIVRGNIIANGASHGMQLRSGGVAVDNLFVRNSIALHVGANAPISASLTAEVHDNVVLDGKDIEPDLPRGWGLSLVNTTGRVTGNIIAHNVLGGSPRGLQVKADATGGVHDLFIEDNVIRDWGRAVLISGDADNFESISLLRNDIQDLRGRRALIEITDAASVASIRHDGNRLYSSLVSADAWVRLGELETSLARLQDQVDDQRLATGPVHYPDADRDLASYARLLGDEGGAQALLAAARSQSRDTWRPELSARAVNRYLRAGFGLQTP